MVTTVVNTPPSVPTILNRHLITKALHIVQPYFSIPLTKPSRTWSTESVRKTKLTTYNLRVSKIPGIVANSSPDTIV